MAEVMISSTLIPKLQQRFPEREMQTGSPPSPCVVFPAIHPEVGDVLIYDDGDELTVIAGKFTHGHFSNYEKDLSEEQKSETISEEVVDFLEALFSDQIVLWGSHQGSGGWYHRGSPSARKVEAKKYVWSGPLE
jgi:hypothetical protein